ncbi:MAG: Nif3-like dinuclear metal center hexameric protein [Thermanaerothrix sp.]|nr:Nif3-like dinuclear metal center hexameric protein [Thermanaerothrix sp.]
MRVSEFAALLEEVLPFRWAYDWDNCGLVVGSGSSWFDRVAISLDADIGSIRWAAENHCSLLVVHHPPVFNPMRRVVDDVVGLPIIEALRLGVSLYACHTNWDVAPSGASVVLGNALGLSGMVPLEPRGDWGLGVAGDVDRSSSLKILSRAKALWGLSWARLEGSCDSVSRVAICAGSGGDMWPLALEAGAELFITADVKYHSVRDAVASGLALGVVDHGEMEWATMEALGNLVRGLGVEVLLAPRGEVVAQLV